MACVPGEKVPVADDYDPHFVENLTAISYPREIPEWEVALKISFYVISFLLDITGNSIVILIIFVNKRMRSTTNVLILNLAISDIMVGCFSMWVHAGNSITKEWPFGYYVCKVNTFMQVLAVTSSVLTLTAISVERFFAIIFPLKRRITPVFAVVVIAANWVLSIAMASPHLVVRRTYEYYWKDRHQIWCDEVWPKFYIDYDCNYKTPGRVIYYTVVCVVMYFIPIFIMFCAYTIILVKLILRKGPGTVTSATATLQNRSRKKVIRMLIAVVVVFIVCWTPQQALILWDIYRTKSHPIDDYVLDIKYMAVYIAYTNSAINPILYGGFNENFRRGFRDAFRCILWKKRNTVAPALPVQRLERQKATTQETPKSTQLPTSNVSCV